MNAMHFILGIVLLALAGTGYPVGEDNFRLPSTRSALPEFLQVAQDCRPKDALPSGSYQNSCRDCRIEGCKWLICRCDGKDASADTTRCPGDNYCNNNGKLQCGEC